MEKIAEKIAEKIGSFGSADIGIILGSGWGGVISALKDKKIYPYESFEGMPKCGVSGHSGNFVTGSIGSKKIIAMQGRFHLYEGKSTAEVTLPIRIMHKLGIKSLIITNAAGGINKEFSVGDIMFIKDHINLSGFNPLIGISATKDMPVFIDMGNCYDKALLDCAKKAAEGTGAAVKSGVYLQVIGPSYETPAEIRAFAALGADAVGMSTAVEAVFARYLNLKVLGISCITNMAAGTVDEKLSHGDVLEVSAANSARLSAALTAIIERCGAL